MKTRLLVPFFVALVLLTAGCSRVAPVPRPSFQINSNSKKDTAEAIKQALKGRKWVLLKESPGTMIAQYSRGSHSATVQLNYGAGNVSIDLLESQNLKQGVDKNGQSVIHKAYSNWIQYLEKDIKVNASY